MGDVGGDPGSIDSGGAALQTAGDSVGSRSTGIALAVTNAEAGAGDATLCAAIARFGAAYGRFTADVGTELHALGTLATTTAANLRAAGGQPR